MRKWLCNCGRMSLDQLRLTEPVSERHRIFIGKPISPDHGKTSEELETMGLMGVYLSEGD